MHYAIIAAGEGSRLRQEGISSPKPLVSIEGMPMIDRLLGIMTRCRAESISIICNAVMADVQQHLQHYIQQHSDEVVIRLVVESTPSSMHSLARLSEIIPDGKVCVTTVDTIFRESDFAAYIDAFERSEDGLFAVTEFVDDEKPLWVACESDSSFQEVSQSYETAITGFYDRREDIPLSQQFFVSGGIYGLHTATAWPVLRRCLSEGQSRMRNYQRALIHAGIPLRAYRFEQIMDIDHASDIEKAEHWLASQPKSSLRRVLAISRAPEHSPNNVAKDAAILRAVAQRLRAQGCRVDEMSEEQFCSADITQLNEYDQVFHMARRFKTLNRLQQIQSRVVNQPRSVQTTAHSREVTFTLLQEKGIQVPPLWSYDPEVDEMFQCEPDLQSLLPGWVKATRSQGAQPDDVVWVETALDADAHIIEFAAQQVPDIMVMKHIEGDLLKVYAVAGGQQLFLRTFYPQELEYSKFGKAELHNAPLAHYPFSEAALQQLAQNIARVLELQIFGFDVIVSKDGSMTVIDVNDWPSFSSCREEAADAICQILS